MKSHLRTHSLKVLIMAVAVVLGADTVRAAGFSCLSVDRNERMDLFYASLEDGSPATDLVILDPTVSKARQHIASFHAADGLLTSEQHVVIASVNTAYPESSRKGERVGGTVLGSLAQIKLDIDARSGLVDGASFAAQATYLKKTGQELTQDFDCTLFEGPRAPEELYF